MRKQILRSAPLVLLLLSGCVADPIESATPQKITADGTKIFRSEKGRLTEPSLQTATVIASDFLLHHGLVANAGELSATTHAAGNVTHVKITQTIDGLRVHGAYAKVAVSDKGEILQVIERLAMSDGELEAATIGEREALTAAMLNLGFTESPGESKAQDNVTFFAPTGELYRAPSVEHVAFVGADGAAEEGFLVETWSGDNNQLDYTLIDGHGKIVSVENRTNHDSYKVFPEDPGKNAQTVVNGPGAGNAQSPSGWLSGAQTTIKITGNNAKAYLDTDANNQPDTGGTTVADGNFLSTEDFLQQPSATVNKAVSVQNLFYLNNVIHDTLYSHGFTESAGNFQTNNFGLGGLGNDPVNAEAQDGSGTNNANFATPTDGSAPRMQMYLFSALTPTGFTTVNNVDYGTFPSTFGAAFTLAGVTGNLAIYNDNTGVTSDACEAAPAGSLTNKIAIVDRGTCTFTVKVLNAQNAGAKGVVIVNNAAVGAFSPSGTDRKVKIPSGMVTQADGATLKGLAGASGKLRKNPTTPIMLDGDLDSDVVFHEYGHGLTWRMVGGMSGKLAGAIGEGASDVVAFLMNGDDIMGEYLAGPAGIRRYPYNNYPLTYSSVTGAEVHDDGEIFAGAMWRVLQNYLAAGLTPADAMDDFVRGLDFTVSTPAYEDMRDGMLQATANNGRQCLVWKGYAASGIGVGADGVVNANGTVTITQSFTVPASCP